METLAIISRDEAQVLGRSFFYTGKPCKNGHTAPRYVTNGGCKDCINRKRSVYGSNVLGFTLVMDGMRRDEKEPLIALLKAWAPHALAEVRKRAVKTEG